MTGGFGAEQGEAPGEPGNEARRFEHEGGWQGRIFITTQGGGGFVAGHADLYRADAYICRIVLARQFNDEWLATNALRAKAIDWIDDWNRREHSGDTGFSSL